MWVIDTLLKLLFFLFLIYMGVLFYLFFFQRKILFIPDTLLSPPSHYGIDSIETVTLRTADHIHITAWYHQAKEGEKTLVYFHGNAGNIAGRIDKLSQFIDKDIGILAISYRGYGDSEGTPTEQGLKSDGMAAMAYLLENGLDPSHIVLYGESLGSGVATYIATQFNVAGLILEAPYTSIADRAKELYPYIPVTWLLKDHFNSLHYIADVKAPIMIIHGKEDTTIPIHHSQKIVQFIDAPVETHFLEGVGHVDFDLEELASYTSNFIHNLP